MLKNSSPQKPTRDLNPTANATPTRRSMLAGLGVGTAMLAAGGFQNWLRAADAPKAENFSFVVLNDLHYFDQKCVPFFKKTVELVKAQKPELVLIVGDMTENATKLQNGEIAELIKALELPTYIVPGNHDHTAEKNDRTFYEQSFPKSINMSFEHRGWHFLGLDSTQGHAGSDTVIAKSTLDYLADETKKIPKTKPLIMFSHFPHGILLPSRPKNVSDVLNALSEHSVQAIYNGHFHSSTKRVWGKSEITTNTCCSFYRKNHDFDPHKGFFVCKTKDGVVEREYVEVKLA